MAMTAEDFGKICREVAARLIEEVSPSVRKI